MTEAENVVALEAQKAELDKKIAAIAVPLIQEAMSLLKDQPVAELMNVLNLLHDQLPTGTAKEQINNVLIVLSHVPVSLEQEIVRFQALIGEAAT